MPFLTAAVISATAAVAGAAVTGYSAIQNSKQASQAANISQQQEALRKRQLELDNRRRTVQLIREAQANRARAVSGATNRGIQTSSALEGGLGSIASQSGSNLLAQNQNYQIGTQLFDLNAQLSGVRGQSAINGAIGDFGKTLFANSQAIGRIGQTLFDSNATPFITAAYDSKGNLIG